MSLSVSCLDNNYKVIRPSLIAEIDVEYTNIQKKSINVLITKLVKNIVESHTFFAYETNVTNIDNIFVPIYDIEFELPFKNNNKDKDCDCFFRKYDNYPLLILCSGDMGYEFWLKEIKQEIFIENQNINYNFIIKPVNISDKISKDGTGSEIYSFFPEVLDFTKTGILYVTLYCDGSEDITGITFNEKEKDLVCEDLGSDEKGKKYIKKCVVPKSHFNGQKSGEYFIKYQNHLNTKSIAYEVPPIKVILTGSGAKDPDDDSDSAALIIIIVLFSCVILIGIGFFLFKKYKRKSEGNEIENNFMSQGETNQILSL